jgi:nucleotide-binding universal stress UspA family protein
VALPGSPASRILEEAHRWLADLIVLGSRGRSRLGRLLLGSVSQKVAAEALCSVRVSRARARENASSQRLLIGIDGSVEADCALRAVATRRWPIETQIKLVAVEQRPARTAVGRHLPKAMIRGFEDRDEPERVWLRYMVGEAQEFLRTKGLEAAVEVKLGNASRVLVEDADQWGADCIYLGGRTRSRLDRLVVGSVSNYVVNHSVCSVEIVRSRGIQLS